MVAIIPIPASKLITLKTVGRTQQNMWMLSLANTPQTKPLFNFSITKPFMLPYVIK
jgi:hypothetical protein